MNVLRCYIVDNEEHCISQVARYISDTPGLTLAGSETNAEEALRKLSSGTPIADLVFLDIEMPEMSGLDLAGMLPPSTHIVYTTAHEEFALRAFDTNVIDYLLKPVTYPRFMKSVQKFTALSEAVLPLKNPGDLYIQNQSSIIRVRLDEIYYVEAAQNYVRVVLADKVHLTYFTMKEMEELLPAQFVRVHKSFLVNMDHFQSLDAGMIHLAGKMAVPLGPYFRKDFMARLSASVVRSRR